MRFIPDATSESLSSFIRDTVKPGSTIHTDGWSGYNQVASFGYDHQITVVVGAAPIRSPRRSTPVQLRRNTSVHPAGAYPLG